MDGHALDEAQRRLVFPLDVPDLDSARRWVDRLREDVGVFKVGLELFTAVGPEAVRVVGAADRACFLDLKLHDIPATVGHAVESAVRLDARYLTVHASAGPSSLRAAAQATDGTDTTLLAVTVLTSLDAAEIARIGFTTSPEETVARLAGMAWEAGIRGFVCSPHEVARLRAELGPDALLVVPGIRPVGSATDDQRRAATPRSAIEAGANLLVVGRPIREAVDPIAAARRIADEVRDALA